MNSNSGNDKAFLNRLTSIVEANLKDENFGVRELADKMRMNRSSIHRKLKSITKKSVSEFIREIRLQRAKELLEEGNSNISEVAYNVGFGSPSYFTKSFHDYFGFTPGELKIKELEAELKSINTNKKSSKKLYWFFSSILLIVIISVLAIGKFFIFKERVPVEESILVDQLKNLSSEESKQYFALGLTNTIRIQLGKISGLKVISGPTAEQFKESTRSLSEIARQVNADFILYGDTQLNDSVVLINLELSDARTGITIWTENYRRASDDIFDIELDIAKNVADQLQLILSPEEIRQIKKLNPRNFEAYINYEMGQYLCIKRDSASIYKGIEYFEKAIEMDSDYTLAYAGLADGYYALAITGTVDWKVGYDKAYKMAEKALEKDSTLAEAYAVLGVVTYFAYWKWEEARKFLEKAIQVDSNCMVAHLYYASFLDIVREREKALYHINRAIELNPYFGLPWGMKGAILSHDKKYTESMVAFRRVLELKSKASLSNVDIFYNYIDLNDEKNALESLRQIWLVDNAYQKYLSQIKPVYKTSGMNGILKLILDANLKEHKNACPAELYARLGMNNEALDCLERRCRKGNVNSRSIIRPEFESLHSNPRFQALVDSMNLRTYFPNLSK